METAWQRVAAVGNVLLRSARSILATHQPSTAPCCLAPYHRQNECGPAYTPTGCREGNMPELRLSPAYEARSTTLCKSIFKLHKGLMSF